MTDGRILAADREVCAAAAPPSCAPARGRRDRSLGDTWCFDKIPGSSRPAPAPRCRAHPGPGRPTHSHARDRRRPASVDGREDSLRPQRVDRWIGGVHVRVTKFSGAGTRERSRSPPRDRPATSRAGRARRGVVAGQVVAAVGDEPRWRRPRSRGQTPRRRPRTSPPARKGWVVEGPGADRTAVDLDGRSRRSWGWHSPARSRSPGRPAAARCRRGIASGVHTSRGLPQPAAGPAAIEWRSIRVGSPRSVRRGEAHKALIDSHVDDHLPATAGRPRSRSTPTRPEHRRDRS